VHQTRPKKGTRHLASCFAHTYLSPYLGHTVVVVVVVVVVEEQDQEMSII